MKTTLQSFDQLLDAIRNAGGSTDVSVAMSRYYSVADVGRGEIVAYLFNDPYESVSCPAPELTIKEIVERLAEVGAQMNGCSDDRAYGLAVEARAKEVREQLQRKAGERP